MTRPFVLTMGDPAGIGPELTLRLWHMRLGMPFFVLADAQVLARADKQLGLTTPIHIVTPEETCDVFDHALPLVPLQAPCEADFGQPNPATAGAICESIERAVAYVQAGQAKALITNPIAKKTLYDAGFPYPGHTEYLGALTQTTPIMLLWSPLLAVVPVTIHMPLHNVAVSLTRERLEATARIVHRDLHLRFGIESPRIAVAGLNPHAGEGGTMGREEIDIIIPALEALRAEGLDIRGPYPADTLFHTRARAHYDVALTMYHDRGSSLPKLWLLMKA